MKKYMVMFQGDSELFTLDAENNYEARKIVNRNISIKEVKDNGRK